jgi:hypothetical protein
MINKMKAVQGSQICISWLSYPQIVIVNLSAYLQAGELASCLEETDSLWSRLVAHTVELAAQQ